MRALQRIKDKVEELGRQQTIIPFGQSSSGRPYAPAIPSPSAHRRPVVAPPPLPRRPGATSESNELTKPYWVAEFNAGTPVSKDWEHKLGNENGWGNNELENYTDSPNNSFFSNNKLVIRAVSVPRHVDHSVKYTSARLVSRQTLDRPRGCLTTHLSLPCASGIWPAFWLLPKEPFAWPQDGEIDIAETWNGDCENHSCLHWGFHTPQDRDKHLVRETRLPHMASGRPIRYDFIWDCPSGGGPGGRLMWLIDNRPVMKATMPGGTRPIQDWCIILNIAMGGNGCGGKVPYEGTYEYVVHDITLTEQPEGGWRKFDIDWKRCADGVVH